MKFRLNGDTYEIPDPDGMSTKELREVKQNAGVGLRGLMQGLQEMDPDCVIAIIYVAKRRAGEKVSWSDFDDIRPLADVEWPDEGEEAEEETGEADESGPPTTRSRSTGSTRTGGSTST